MKSVRLFFIALILLTSVSCQSIWTGMADGIATPFLLISFELSTITALAIAHKDSLGQWPQDRGQLSSFYTKHKTSFSQDSLFQVFSFSEPNFNQLSFVEQEDSLTISFSSKALPDTLYHSKIYSHKKDGDFNFYRYVGSAKLYLDSTATNNYVNTIYLDSIIQYDSKMNKFGNIIQ